MKQYGKEAEPKFEVKKFGTCEEAMAYSRREGISRRRYASLVPDSITGSWVLVYERETA